MGFLDEITKIVGSKLSGDAAEAQGGLMESALNLLNSPEVGGLSGLIDTFKNKGLGGAVASWIGTGENETATAEQMTNALGSDKIQEIAAKLGITDSAVSSGLAALLPQVIDKLTPDGVVPEGRLLDQGLDILKQKLLG